MNADCFPWNKLPLTLRESLLQLPLRCSFPITSAEASFPLSWNCSPRKRQLQLRGDFFLVFDLEKAEILSFFESDPGVSILIKSTETSITDPSLELGSDPMQKGLMKVADLRQGRQEVTFYFDLTPGKLIELYRIVPKTYTTQLDFHQLFKPQRKIGKGLTSVVYEVIRVPDKAKLAVKAFSKSAYYTSSNGRGKLAFLKEFKFLSQCSHAGICRFEGVYETDNTIYIVQEYYAKSLAGLLLGTEELARSKIISLMEDLLRAVLYLHQRGIFHRDIKLENIMLRRQKDRLRPVIIDLGMAHHVDDPNYLFEKCGTPGFLAPEVFRVGSKHPKGDIFGIGVIFYVLLFKKPVFTGSTNAEVLANNKDGLMNLDYAKLNGEDGLVRDLLLRMLETDIDERISAEDALKHPLFRQAGPETPGTSMGNTEETIFERHYFSNTISPANQR